MGFLGISGLHSQGTEYTVWYENDTQVLYNINKDAYDILKVSRHSQCTTCVRVDQLSLKSLNVWPSQRCVINIRKRLTRRITISSVNDFIHGRQAIIRAIIGKNSLNVTRILPLPGMY